MADADGSRVESPPTVAPVPPAPIPVVTLALVAANVLVFAVMVACGVSAFGRTGEALVAWGASYGPYEVDGQWWRLLSAAFVHGGVAHLSWNMLYLLVAGPRVERMFGRRAYLAIYLLAAGAGNVASLAAHPALAGVGSSTAVFGVLGALIAGAALGDRSGPHKRLLLWCVILSVLDLLAGGLVGQPALAAHLGGLVAGLVLGVALRRSPATLTPASGRRVGVVVAVAAVCAIGGAAFAFARVQPPITLRALTIAIRADSGQLDVALHDARALVADRPDDAAVQELVGTLYFAKGQNAEAIVAFERARALNPGAGRTWLASALTNVGRYDDAVRVRREAMARSPADADAHGALGFDLIGSGNVAGAIAAYRRAAELGRSPRWHMRIGYADFLDQRYADAAAEYARYLEKTKAPDVYPLLWYAATLRQLGQADRADAVLAAHAERFRGEGWADALFRFADGSVTEAALLARASTPAERCEATFLAGSMRLAAGDRAGARALFEQTEQTRVYEYFEYVGARQRLRQLAASR